MPTLEERVKTLESDVIDLKGRVDVNEGETENIAELIKVEHRLTNSRIDRLGRDISEMRRDVAELKTLPRVLAEIVREALIEHDRKG